MLAMRLDMCKRWLTKKIRRHLMKARGKAGFGWKGWSTKGLYANYHIFSDLAPVPGKFFQLDRQ